LFGGLNRRVLQELPSAAYGVYSTAIDMARFGQMFLNRGRYGEKQLLSPATVAAMTRNQIPGISAYFANEVFPEASWGLGWDVNGGKKSRENGALSSTASFSHGGFGGVQLWIDPVYELVGVYFSVWLRTIGDGKFAEWPIDLFVDAVTAAAVEE
jgi:serine-type D-Ala-D-Ala carboxypeptidase